MRFFRIFSAVLFWTAACLLSVDVKAEGTFDISQYEGKKIIVGTKVSPPFVIQNEDGSFEGISIELWEKVANDLGLEYEYKTFSLDELLDAVKNNKVDVAVGALTITEERETYLDFTVPYHITRSSIATRKTEPQFFSVVKGFFSIAFLKTVGGLLGLLLIVGVIVWLLERRANPEHFGGKGLKGIGSGLWWSAVTMTTVGYGDKAPTTFWGRVVGLVWMFMALIVISSFTAAITSAVTVQKLSGLIEGPEDLVKVTVGTQAASTSETYLISHNVRYLTYDDVPKLLEALENKEVDAVVYDNDLLRYNLKEEGYERDIILLSHHLQPMYYGFALPSGSGLREALNQRMLYHSNSKSWNTVLYQYLGRTED